MDSLITAEAHAFAAGDLLLLRSAARDPDMPTYLGPAERKIFA
jgi:hypothetical protein